MTTEDDVFAAPTNGFAFEPAHPGEVLVMLTRSARHFEHVCDYVLNPLETLAT